MPYRDNKRYLQAKGVQMSEDAWKGRSKGVELSEGAWKA
jgi:hypothetical protein